MTLFRLLSRLLSSLLLIAMSLSCSRIFAVDIPLSVLWQSQNNVYFDARQNGKEYSWDEQYRAEISIVDFSYSDMILNLTLDTQALFTDPRLRLRELSIGYPKGPWLIEAGSREHGYGRNFLLDTLPNLNYDSHSYIFQSMRLNSLKISYQSPGRTTELDIGGNVHNQATMLVSHLLAHDYLNLRLSFEFRARDNYRNYPVSISAIDFDAHSQNERYITKNAVAFAYHLNWDDLPAEQELYLQSEHSYQIFPNSYLHSGIVYQKRLYTPSQIQRYRFAVQQDFKPFSIIGMTELVSIERDDLWLSRVISNYHLNQNNSIGIVYEYAKYQSSDSRHKLGLLLDFRFDLTK